MAKIDVFDGDHLEGFRETFTGSVPHLSDHPKGNMGGDWNDEIVSFRIHSGTWQFFEHYNFNLEVSGWSSRTIGPGRYDWCEDAGFPKNKASSLKLVSE